MLRDEREAVRGEVHFGRAPAVAGELNPTLHVGIAKQQGHPSRCHIGVGRNPRGQHTTVWDFEPVEKVVR